MSTSASSPAPIPTTASVPTGAMDQPRGLVLENDRVRLEPLGPQHVEGLREVVADGEIWRIPYAPHVPSPEQVADTVAAQRASDDAGRTVSWAVIDRGSDRVVGHTTFLNLSLRDRRLELGTTYMAGSTHGTGLNAATKLVLLTHAFEQLTCLGVEFRVHHLNIASRRAVERLGAQQDGILRAHRIMPDGTLRHTVVYSILADEWTGVKASLEHRLRG
ncbi:GNAT family N-acetyltransferase [Brachybacterium fresconis]|uniref:RimJ/RimL family protein N-acetyltransferase n=1 Tax=Brachybacterium fresconis TaxID=173363 RepID=A0ABS4YJD4_9MICO|nr:GNAT family N-acetyltransferase [Brachybacterium fresconis]MBP2408911.1 RimJ/RimL family protein N-acetyltransferase [Brachybacterium fresconis]